MTPARRTFITGLVSLVAAPAIIRAGSLMPVKVMLTESDWRWELPPAYGRASDLLDAQQSINFRRSVALQIINSRGLQPYSSRAQ